MDARLLVACGSCRRQYDVSGMKTGEHVRCRCGVLVRVPEIRPHEARVLHCSGCGGKLRDAGRRCDYCGAEITVKERNLGPACPGCFGRLAGGARFCSECGIEIRPEALRTVRADARCPRCEGDLLHHDMAEAQYTECGACGGVWLDASSFQRVVDSKEAEALPFLKEFVGDWRKGPAAPDQVRYLPCPTCRQMMHRRNFSGSGIIIDSCKGHGFWFDAHELEKIVTFVRSGGLEAAKKREVAALNRKLDEARSRKSQAPVGGWGYSSADTWGGASDWVGLVVAVLRAIGVFRR
jgi:Zn-finger nucleic acid-binding protein